MLSLRPITARFFALDDRDVPKQSGVKPLTKHKRASSRAAQTARDLASQERHSRAPSLAQDDTFELGEGVR
ncbi:MAG: hypothetical protein QOH24_1598 [Verrucomicrobiota bacterium]